MKLRTLILAACLATPLHAQDMTLADLSDPQRAGDWRFFTDQVMGGVSTGQARIENGALTLTGTVSTENNGGFIQARLDGISLPEGASRLVARVRGDGQTYYLHLRTRATMLPWQYYQAAFTAPEDWGNVEIPLSAFKPSGRMLPGTPAAGSVRSVALVAYGRDHEAQVSLSEIRAE
ncbi:CIA30 family protein [Pseudoponticoccus marisrubri]|uniref:NADH:ubiquinone oxidoreductase intermediate-associated protein 30 domain-containing protein n=1 Tax=Pseudoponticoccus marisrubri TaxID=1685382 RepID=A0A0W7WGI8_9RHOB|nr:CIA30 family protein [Pseudoponticoccus marisrubri]KUF09686.1 hypothetical protein AVJ23_16155 [Pseudoponticoccus marisrubri]